MSHRAVPRFEQHIRDATAFAPGQPGRDKGVGRIDLRIDP